MKKKTFIRLLAVYLVFAIFLLTLPSQGWAMFIPSGQAAGVRQADISTIQKTLETAVVKQRLMDFGLSSEEALARINSLPDDQVHQFAANLDSIQAGADGAGALIFILLVAIIVVVILQVSGHRVVVR
ncbi:MAG: PA2779 family protein [Betaproteobacteria bacterium]